MGHSTSGDHRRYKTPERLQFEEEFDCNRRMANWMIDTGLATAEEIEQIKKEAKREATRAAHWLLWIKPSLQIPESPDSRSFGTNSIKNANRFALSCCKWPGARSVSRNSVPVIRNSVPRYNNSSCRNKLRVIPSTPEIYSVNLQNRPSKCLKKRHNIQRSRHSRTAMRS